MSAPEKTAKPMKWVLLEDAPWEPTPRTVGHRMARWLVRRGHTVAWISPAGSPWDRLLGERQPPGPGAGLGEWLHPRLFVLRPFSLLPVRPFGPFDSNAAWNGSERFSVPRAGKLVREAGFAKSDALVFAGLDIPVLARFAQPRVVLMRLQGHRHRQRPHVVRRREEEIIREADCVFAATDLLMEKARDAGAVAVEEGFSFRRMEAFAATTE